MRKTVEDVDREVSEVDPEILPVSDHERSGIGRFASLYAAEHVAGTEFIFGATFVIMGVGFKDILIGLIIGNTLAVLSFWLVTTPIARKARGSLYTYLWKIGGSAVSRLYNLANAIVFVTIAAAMITVSATAVRHLIGIPAQTEAYPTDIGFVALVVIFGGMVMLPGVAESVTGFTSINSWSDFADIAEATVFTGVTPEGEPGIGMIEVAAFAWAANTFSHFGLIDTALLRYAKKSWHGLGTATGMMFGHYVAWISAGFMGAATAAITMSSITILEPGEVSWYALSWAGFLVVVVAGWTTANPNLYRASLAAQGVFPAVSRKKVTIIMGVILVVVACISFVYRNYAPMVTLAGVVLVPIDGIIFAEHHIFERLGMTKFWAKFWAKFREVRNYPAIFAWIIALVAAGLMYLAGIPYYFIFAPAWVVSTVAYTLLARRAGAAESYPDAQADEDLYFERALKFRDEEALKRAAIEAPDKTVLSKVLLGLCIVLLTVIFVFAWIVLFNSSDMYSYLMNSETFSQIAFVGTILYFIVGFWKLWRSQNYRGTEKIIKAGREHGLTAETVSGDAAEDAPTESYSHQVPNNST